MIYVYLDKLNYELYKLAISKDQFLFSCPFLMD